MQDPATGTLPRFGLHAIDAIGLVQAMILRIQALISPVQTLVLGGTDPPSRPIAGRPIAQRRGHGSGTPGGSNP